MINLINYVKKNTFKVVIIFGFAFLLSMMSVAYFYQTGVGSRAQGEAVNLTFNPSSANASTNQDFTTTIRAVPAIALDNLRGYFFKVIFDKTKVQVKNIQYISGTVSVGLGNDNNSLDTVNSQGYINVQGEYQTASGQIINTTGADIVSVTFTSLGGTASSLTLDTTTGKFYQYDPTTYVLVGLPIAMTSAFSVNGGEAPTSTPVPSVTQGGATVTPTPSTGTTTGNITLNLKLKFQGILKKPADQYNSMIVRVTAEDTKNNKSVGTGTFTAGDNGIWSGSVSINAIAGDGFKIFIKGPKHVQKRVCVATPTETSPGTYHCENGAITLTAGANNLDFSGIYMLSGDLPVQDTVVDSYDTSLVFNNLGHTDSTSLGLADINLDGIVDTQDYSLVIAALSVRGDEGE